MKAQKEDLDKYLGKYTSGSENTKAYLLFVIIFFPAIMILISVFMYFQRPEKLSESPWFLFITIEIVLIMYYFSYTKKTITLAGDTITFTQLSGRKTIPFSKIVKFTRIEWPYKRKVLWGNMYYGEKYEITYISKNKKKKASFYFVQTNKAHRLIKFLRHKLKHVPQRVIDGGKEKEWPISVFIS